MEAIGAPLALAAARQESLCASPTACNRPPAIVPGIGSNNNAASRDRSYDRNQAPGIPDRRKSLRPGWKASRKNPSRASSGISIRVSLAEGDLAVEPAKEEEEEEDEQADIMDKSDEDKNVGVGAPKPAALVNGGPSANVRAQESFEDAVETSPRTLSDELDSAHDQMDEQNEHENADQKETADASEDAVEGSENPESKKEAVHSRQAPADADRNAPSPSHSRKSTLEGAPSLQPAAQDSSPPAASRERSISPSKSLRDRSLSPHRVMPGLSGDVALPSQPPPSTADRKNALEQRQSPPPQQPPREGLARKASSGFGALFGRMGSIRKPAKSPPGSRSSSRLTERRGTGASLTSFDGNGLATIHDNFKPSLQDQFSNIRRQEELGFHEANGRVTPNDDDKTEKAESEVGIEPPTSPARSMSGLKSPQLNPSLPPGTASGMTAGPAAEPSEINWDLWQQLIYEGPSAVQKASGEELNQAIIAGIPQVLRGVIWQVMAESKNDELEHIYRTLKARGTDVEGRPPASRNGSTPGVNGTVTDRETVMSDASSDHSDQSASGMASPPASVDSATGEARPKSFIEEKRKRDSVMLQKLEKAIKRDMGSRTSYSKYTQSAGLQDGLFGLCKAYALFDEGVGYAQGINFIAMPLLFNMAEEEAFTLLVRLMSKYDLRSMFTADMAGLHLRLYQFERLLEDHEPAVYCHLRRRNVGPQLYATQWFLTLFAYRFPLQLVLRIYDLILSEGLTAILKFGIVLMRRNREALLEMKDMSHLTNFLKEKLFDVYIDKSPSASSLLDSGFFGSVTGGADKELYRADEMVRDACAIKISDETLAHYSVEWEESQRLERERETELETLRTSNLTLTAKVKALEERVQQHDAEHVTIAQDLVKCKVENDTLHDENEGLKVQVTELQKMVDLQPAEVEAKLKEEMSRIMQRNIEVQNENRAIKEEMDEMEHELVNAKVAHAQTQEDYEAIKQKWSSVQALLNDNKS